MTLEFSTDIAIAPVEEISAYETLWTRYKTSSEIGKLFTEYNHAMPRKVVEAVGFERDFVVNVQAKVEDLLPFDQYTALFRNDADYPVALTELQSGPEVVYYQGSLDLLFSKCVAVVGARKASAEGVKRARKLAKLLVANGFTVMSGLAAGIDTAAHSAATEEYVRLGGA